MDSAAQNVDVTMLYITLCHYFLFFDLYAFDLSFNIIFPTVLSTIHLILR